MKGVFSEKDFKACVSFAGVSMNYYYMLKNCDACIIHLILFIVFPDIEKINCKESPIYLDSLNLSQ